MQRAKRWKDPKKRCVKDKTLILYFAKAREKMSFYAKPKTALNDVITQSKGTSEEKPRSCAECKISAECCFVWCKKT